MEDSPKLNISKFGEDENVEEQQQEEEEEEEEDNDDYEEEEIEDKDSDSNASCQRPDAKLSGNLNEGIEPVPEGMQEDSDRDADVELRDSFPCQHCDRHFTSSQGLERHLHIHALANHQTHTFKCKYCSKSFGSKVGRRRHERRHERTRPGSLIKPVGSVCSPLNTDAASAAAGSCTSGSAEGDPKSVCDERGESRGDHACKYCKKVFSTHTNMRRHQRRIHERHLRLKGKSLLSSSQATPLKLSATSSQKDPKLVCETNPAVVQVNEGEQEQQYMLDISSNISENLSFYIDGKIVSTSTVSTCEVLEVNAGTALVSLDAVILNPAQIGQALNVEAATGKEIPGQPLTKRRTATPPLLPQIKTELESESVLTSSSSSIMSSLIESLLPHNTESTVLQKEKTVFLSPKLKQLLQSQDGLRPTLALITDGQNLCSPLSLTVLPAGSGRFKRRTGSPPNTPQQSPTLNVENTVPDQGDSAALIEPQSKSHCSSPALDMSSNDDNASFPPVEEPITTCVLHDGWPSMSGGNSCNQQPLDLSAAVKRSEDEASGEAVLDLSLQRKSPDDLETKGDVTLQPPAKKRKPDASMLAKVLRNEYANLDISGGEQGVDLCENSEAPLVTDIAIVTTSDISAATEGLVFGLALPAATLNPTPSSNLVSIHPSSCTFALTASSTHTVLPTSPSLFTVLAPPTCTSTSGVVTPKISSEPFVICTDKPFNSDVQCNLSTGLPDWATANAASLVTISQPIDPTLNLHSQMFLADPNINQMALTAPILHSTISSEVPCPPALTLNDSLVNSFNITSNTVLIECTIALDAPENIVPTAITVQESLGEPPSPVEMVINHVEQQQIVSMPHQDTAEPAYLVSSLAESVTLSTTATVIPDFPPDGEINETPVSDVKQEITQKEEKTEESIADSKNAIETTPETAPPTSTETAEEANDTKPVETFTKNFMCNVCDKLFHSMKELGHHVSEHSDTWPYKCEFCVQLFDNPSALLEHRSSLHGVGKIYICSLCTKEFAYLCNLKHHQEELHQGQQCTHTEEEKGKLRPQNYNSSGKVNPETIPLKPPTESDRIVTKDEEELDEATEELFTTIKIMASDGLKVKGPDVRLGINQHYPSYKPPPFPYHNRSPAGSVASATNFTTHNIPQTFSTAIRCTKCGKSFDNMPELHKHILSCANASDKRRYTPKKNPIPLRHFAKAQNGVLSSTNATNGQNAPQMASQTNRPKSNHEAPPKQKLSALNKRKKQLVQRAITRRSKSGASSNKVSSAQVEEEQEIFACPHCSREFTYRRSRTKHMAVCPMKPKETKKRKDGDVSFTKENNGHLRRGAAQEEEKKQAPQQKTRAHSSNLAKRAANTPEQAVLANKKSRTIAKGSVQPQQEAPKLTALSVVRPINSQRQDSRGQHGVKDVPNSVTVVNTRQAPPQTRQEVSPQADTPGSEGVSGQERVGGE
ncbi:PR domain zinc finger protein 2 [Osmerus eperlanus]|uniref:PR domain zinc finger protein 2 n=1 Tax=Osmerus eperlanus TaxID=29151 RepID=UPI002E142E91